MFITRNLNEVRGVAENSTAVIRMPTGWTYHRAMLTLSNLTLAEITEARAVANGDVFQRFKGADELDLLNQYAGRVAYSAGVQPLVWDFERFGLLTRAAREITAVGTGLPAGNGEGQDPRPITTFELQFDIGATASANDPAITARAVMSAASESGLVLRRDRFIYNPGGAGIFEISDFPRKGPIAQITFHSSNINSLKVERDGATVFERTKVENEAEQTNGVRTPQTGIFVFDPAERGYGSETLGIAGVSDLRFTLDMAAAGQVPVTVDYLTPIQRG